MPEVGLPRGPWPWSVHCIRRQLVSYFLTLAPVYNRSSKKWRKRKREKGGRGRLGFSPQLLFRNFANAWFLILVCKSAVCCSNPFSLSFLFFPFLSDGIHILTRCMRRCKTQSHLTSWLATSEAHVNRLASDLSWRKKNISLEWYKKKNSSRILPSFLSATSSILTRVYHIAQQKYRAAGQMCVSDIAGRRTAGFRTKLWHDQSSVWVTILRVVVTKHSRMKTLYRPGRSDWNVNCCRAVESFAERWEI